MKKVIQIVCCSLVLFAFGCQKDEENQSGIEIRTSKTNYVVNAKIPVTIESHLKIQAAYFTCDNIDLRAEKILKEENGAWVENQNLVNCTQMGPMGYFGILNQSETKKDSITLWNEVGKFKLRYRFVVDADTVDFDSNEFTVNALED